MTSKSLWMDIDVAPDAEVLDGVHECDVAVIGSGIAGISTAYELCKRGQAVVVVDRGRICGGMTSRTSAHLAPLCDDLVSEMIKIKGSEATKLFCDSQAAAVDRIEEIKRRSIATSGGSTAICSKAGTCRRISSTRRWTRSAMSELPSTGW
jgi:glycine/D-amino acid oxidase-like deaminating enzyme